MLLIYLVTAINEDIESWETPSLYFHLLLMTFILLGRPLLGNIISLHHFSFHLPNVHLQTVYAA
jgi:hypothetical protein